MTGEAWRDRAADDPPAPIADGQPPATDGRPTPLRLARIHLRLGSLDLARAELESLAGRGMLDEAALLDLAEARWRTGDLAGAGEAAATLVEQGSRDPLALVIASESVAALGRPGEARRLAGLALEAMDTSLDTIFAGMPRSPIWPGEPPMAVPEPHTPVPALLVAAGTTGGAASTAHRTAAVASVVPGLAATSPSAPGSPAAGAALAAGRAALAGGDAAGAALRLGVALRLDPGLADAVLAMVSDRTARPDLALVAGDALRLLGREADAMAAYDAASRTMRGGPGGVDAPR